MSVGGNYYDQQEDKIYYKAPLQHNGMKWRGAIVQQKATYQKGEDGKKKLVPPPPLKILDFKLGRDLTFEKLEELFKGSQKTLRLLVSKTNGHYDPTGLLSPLISQLRDTCRQATLYYKGQMDAEVHPNIWSL